MDLWQQRVRRFAGLHGCKVVVTGRRQAVLDEAVALLRKHGVDALGLQGDVRNISDCEEWVKATLKAYSKLSVLVNCAAGKISKRHYAGALETGGGRFRLLISE